MNCPHIGVEKSHFSWKSVHGKPYFTCNANEICRIFYIIVKFGKHISTKFNNLCTFHENRHWVGVLFGEEIKWISTSIFYIFLDLDQIRCRKYAHNPLSICDFRENRIKTGHTYLTGTNEMTFTRVPWNFDKLRHNAVVKAIYHVTEFAMCNLFKLL